MALQKLLVVTALLVAVWAYYSYSSNTFDPGQVGGQRVLITGASSGIGEQIAYQYARLGAHVFVTARREVNLRKVVAACKKINPDATFGYVVADMSNFSDPQIVVKAAVRRLGGLSHLVLNHAYLPRALSWQASPQSFQNLHSALDINVKSTAFLLAHAIPHLAEARGKVAIVNSMMGKICRPHFSTYCASKFALDGFVQGVRLELQQKGITITNCVLGLIGTDAARDIVDDMKKTFAMNEEALRRNGTFADPAETAMAMIRATSLGEKEMYYPPNQWIRLKVLLRDLIVWMDLNKGPDTKSGN